MKSGIQWLRRNASAAKSAVTHADSVSEAVAHTKLYSKINSMQPHQIRMVFINNEEMVGDTSHTRSKSFQALLDNTVTTNGHSLIVREYILKKHITSLHLIDFQILFINLIGQINTARAEFFFKNPDQIQPKNDESTTKFFEVLDQFFAAVLEENYFPEQIVSIYDVTKELTPEKELQIAFLEYALETNTVNNKKHTHLSAYILTVVVRHQQQQEYATEGFQKFRSIKPRKIAALAVLADQLKGRQTNPVSLIVKTLPTGVLASLEANRVNPSRVKETITDPFRDEAAYPRTTEATFSSKGSSRMRSNS